MDKTVLDNALTPEEQQWLDQFRLECEDLELAALIERLVERFLEMPAREQERYARFEQELEGQDLIPLLEKLMECFAISANQAAVSAGMDPSLFAKILRGEARSFKREHMDALLEDLRTQGKFVDWMELLAWHRSLRVAAVLHRLYFKDIKSAIVKIRDVSERLNAVNEYFKELYPAWAKLYEATKGQAPALLPLSQLAARRAMDKWGWIVVPDGYDLKGVRPDHYGLISTDIIPRKIASLGPGLRVQDTRFGTYTIYRQTEQCPVMELLKAVRIHRPSKRAQPPPEPSAEPTAQYQPIQAETARPEAAEPPKEPQRRAARRTGAILEPELVRVEAGYFWMGSAENDADARENEKPRHRVYLDEYWIGRYPVTNEEYRGFLLANPEQRKPYDWQGCEYPTGKTRHPVVGISWEDAVAYCRWLSQASGKRYRLPTEAEWEKAARGTDGRIYPWGNAAPDASRCNFVNHVGDTTPVGKYSPQGDSPYGSADMAGNVWEWVADWWGGDYYS